MRLRIQLPQKRDPVGTAGRRKQRGNDDDGAWPDPTRHLRHLITLLDELQALGVAFVSLAEGIDATTPAGKLQMHILGAIAEFERERIRERVLAGLQRARREGKRLGRPRAARLPVALPRGLTVRQAAKAWGVSKSTAARWINNGTHPV